MVQKTRDEHIVAEVVKRVEAYTNSHTEYLEDLRKSGDLGTGEAESLEAFSGFLAMLLEKFDTLSSPMPRPSAPSRRPLPEPASQLLLTECYKDIDIAVVPYHKAETYDGAVRRTPEAQWRTLVSALLAAEVEINGKYRMQRGATGEVAKILETVGVGFRNSDLPLHAAYAFDLAADQYRALRDGRSESKCQLAEIRARNAARPRGVRKIAGVVADQVSGYGYRPYRMLRLIVAQLFVYSLVVWWASPAAVDPVRALESVLLDFLNPTGPEPDYRGLGNALLVADSYSGYITLTVFFAMLLRRL